MTRAQALQCGISDEVLERLVFDGTWQRMDRGIYLAASAPASWRQGARAALLWAGADAALGGQAAAYRHGLVRTPPKVIDVWVPRQSSHRPARPRWRLHYDCSGRLQRAWGDPTATTVEDTILDVAHAGDVDGALSILTRALADRRTHEARVRAALDARGRMRHRTVLADVVSERKGYESALEYHADIDVLRDHGLPRGRAQVVTEATTRVDRLLDEYDLVLELDGRAGHEGDGAFRDMWRDNQNTLRGLRVLRLGWSDVRLRPCETARLVAEVLRQQGWQGTLRPCRRCPPRG